MLDTIKRAGLAVWGYIRHREPVVVANGATAAVAAAVAQWQGGLHGEAAWIAVAWGLLTFAQRAFVTPTEAPAGRYARTQVPSGTTSL
jgi:hypothetical protein